MWQVEQAQLYDGTGQRGDCLAACVASIFELPLTECPIPAGGTWADVDQWTRYRWPWLVLEAQYLDPGAQGERCVAASEFLVPICGYWIAAVQSPRFVVDGKHGLHAVVMAGDRLAWDPHPQREMGIGLFSSAMWWVVPDPSKLCEGM